MQWGGSSTFFHFQPECSPVSFLLLDFSHLQRVIKSLYSNPFNSCLFRITIKHIQVGLVLFMHLLPVFLASLPDQPARYWYRLFVWEKHHWCEFWATSTFPFSHDQVRDPVGDVATFMEDYERSYGTNHPTFHRGSYAQVNTFLYSTMIISCVSGAWSGQERVAVSTGKLDFLQGSSVLLLTNPLIGIPSQRRPPGHRPVLHRGDILILRNILASFCIFYQVMANQEVVDYLSQSMLVWACSVRRPEGYRVSQVVLNHLWGLILNFLISSKALRESTYPCLAMIVLRQNRMVVVGRQEGFIQVCAFL